MLDTTAEKENAIQFSLSIYPSRLAYVRAIAQRRKCSTADVIGEAIDLHRKDSAQQPSAHPITESAN